MEDKIIKEEKEYIERKEEKKVPKLNTIYFYLTKGCNLFCRHCWITPKYQTEESKYPELKIDLFKSVITQAKSIGLTGIKLTGGEPLLHSQINDILKFIKTEELRLTVETNGVLCTEELAQLMATCKNPFVSVSLDGADADTHEWVRGVPGSFKAALNGIDNLVKAGFRPQVIMTIMNKNKNQIEAVARLAEKHMAGSIKFNIMQPTGRGEFLHNTEENLNIKELLEIGEWIERDLSERINIKIHHSHPQAFRPLGKVFNEDGDGCSSCGIFGILGVLADGSYALCGIGESIPELVFGKIDEDSLYNIWYNNIILKEIREGIPGKFEGICSRCLMKNFCLGYCLAQNYFKYKNLWKSYWYCNDAYNLNLFPEDRLFPDGCIKK